MIRCHRLQHGYLTPPYNRIYTREVIETVEENAASFDDSTCQWEDETSERCSDKCHLLGLNEQMHCLCHLTFDEVLDIARKLRLVRY